MSEVAAIGASMLEYLQQAEDPLDADDNDPPRSILHSLVPRNDRILVKGPHATSIAMNMAHEIASKCRCNNPSCRCVAVDFLTLRRTSDARFPLFCQEAPKDDSEEDVQVKLQNLENANPTWNQQALRRIRMRHFRSSRDLIAYLLKMHAQSNRMPWGAVIVDGVERFAKHENGSSGSGLSPGETMQVSQILAMLADTGCALQRMADRESIRVVATMQSNLTPNVERIVKNWFPSLVTMDYVKLASTRMLDFVVPPECKIQSSWVLKVTDNNFEESHSKSGFSLVEKKTDGVSLIIWCHQ